MEPHHMGGQQSKEYICGNRDSGIKMMGFASSQYMHVTA